MMTSSQAEMREMGSNYKLPTSKNVSQSNQLPSFNVIQIAEASLNSNSYALLIPTSYPEAICNSYLGQEMWGVILIFSSFLKNKNKK